MFLKRKCTLEERIQSKSVLKGYFFFFFSSGHVSETFPSQEARVYENSYFLGAAVILTSVLQVSCSCLAQKLFSGHSAVTLTSSFPCCAWGYVMLLSITEAQAALHVAGGDQCCVGED